jgi:PAS domain S-box-containing protein
MLSLNFLMHTLFYALPGWALLRSAGRKSLLRAVLGYSFLLVAGVFLTRSLWILIVPELAFSGFGAVIGQIMLPTVYYMMLISGFSMLLLAKENSDRELHESLQEQQAILETLPTGLAIVRDRVIERCNPSLEQMFGHAPGTLSGRNVQCLYESDVEFDRYGQVIYNEIELVNRFRGEIPAIRPTGERFWTWVEGRSIFPERSQRHAVFSVTDITLPKLQQELLARQKDELQATTQAKNRFIRMVSHEFRTPFGLLTTSADILDRYWDRLTTEERTTQNHCIRDGVQLINALINSILAYNHSDTESAATASERVDVGALCH